MHDPLGEGAREWLESLPDNRKVDVAWAVPAALALALKVAGLHDRVWFWVVLAACLVAGIVLLMQLLGRASRAAARGELI
jgi:hypothetical protein